MAPSWGTEEMGGGGGGSDGDKMEKKCSPRICWSLSSLGHLASLQISQRLFGNLRPPRLMLLGRVPRLNSIAFWLLTRRKKSAPDGRAMRCDPDSSVTGWPSLNHWISGGGLPSALQLSVVGSWRGTITSRGCSVILGTSTAAKKSFHRLRFGFTASLFH